MDGWCLGCGSSNTTTTTAADRPGDSETADLDICGDCGTATYAAPAAYPSYDLADVVDMAQAVDIPADVVDAIATDMTADTVEG